MISKKKVIIQKLLFACFLILYFENTSTLKLYEKVNPEPRMFKIITISIVLQQKASF